MSEDKRSLLPTPTTLDNVEKRTTHAGGNLTPNLNDVAANYLPTPKARDWTGHGPSSMERNTPDLNAISRILENDLEVPVEESERLLPTPAAADGSRGQDFARAGREGSGGDDLVTTAVKLENAVAWGKYEAAIRCWERVTRPAPAPTELNKNGNPRLAAGFSEWLMGWPEGHVTDPEIGISRNDQLRITGNGVVPQQCAHALRILLRMAWENP